MKKVLYVAIMALTLGMFAGCTGATAGKVPVIDEQNATVNGQKFDNETYACWQFDWQTVEQDPEGSETANGTDFYWMTEFGAQSFKASWDYSNNQKVCIYGICSSIKGTSKLTKTNHTISECDD